MLAKRLKNIGGDLILAIPRGGVVVAYEVAKELNLPLDIIVTRKIGAPHQPELALGAVDADGEIVGELGEFGEIKEIIEREIGEIKRREKLYRGGKKALKVDSKVVILVDDGIATGATTLAAINYLKRHQVGQIILAVPVVSQKVREELAKKVDRTVVLHAPFSFQAVGQFYDQFNPVSDAEVVELLAR